MSAQQQDSSPDSTSLKHSSIIAQPSTVNTVPKYLSAYISFLQTSSLI